MRSLKADSPSPAITFAAVGFALRSSAPPLCYQTPWNTWHWHLNSISSTIFNSVCKCLIRTTLPDSKQISLCIITCISFFLGLRIEVEPIGPTFQIFNIVVYKNVMWGQKQSNTNFGGAMRWNLFSSRAVMGLQEESLLRSSSGKGATV